MVMLCRNWLCGPCHLLTFSYQKIHISGQESNTPDIQMSVPIRVVPTTGMLSLTQCVGGIPDAEGEKERESRKWKLSKKINKTNIIISGHPVAAAVVVSVVWHLLHCCWVMHITAQHKTITITIKNNMIRKILMTKK